MSSKKSDHKCGFPWKTGCFLVIILVGAIAAYDIHKHGSFDASNTGKFLNNNAVTINIQKTWVLTKLYHTKCLEYLETNFPEQFSTVVDFSMPYFHLAGDFYLVAKNLTVKLYENVSNCLNQKYPVFFEIIEMYIPVILNSGENFFSKTLEIVKTYSEWITEQTIENSVRAARYLKTNVFVGKLSPESIKSYAFQAINTTHTFASLTYDWVYEKVQTLSKVE